MSQKLGFFMKLVTSFAILGMIPFAMSTAMAKLCHAMLSMAAEVWND